MTDRRPGPGVAGALRLVATLPFYLAGVTAMSTSVAARGLLVGGGIGVLLAGVAAANIPGPLPFWGYVAISVLVGGMAFLGWIGRARDHLRTRTRVHPAAALLTTASPATAAERRVEGILGRLARQVDLAEPSVRVAATDRPVCFTVGYPDEGPPARLIERVLEVRFRRRRDRSGSDDGGPTTPTPSAFEDPITADYVVVVSTGLLESLSRAELTGVLAHELAHVRNGDLSLMNRLLVPVLWAESALSAVPGRNDSGSLTAAVRSAAKVVTLAVSLPGVAVFTRGREYAADRGAAEITGDPASLASALETLDDDATETPLRDMRAAAVLNVVAPGSGGLPYSHPPTERRVERLRAMAAEQLS